jgi:predicted DNA-binding protein (UPF0251 family)
MRDADQATDGPEDAVVARLTNEQLLACIRQLGSEQQECISLRFLQGLSVSETAAVMGKKDGAVKALQHRAVRRLAALLPEGLRRRVCPRPGEAAWPPPRSAVTPASRRRCSGRPRPDRPTGGPR